MPFIYPSGYDTHINGHDEHDFMAYLRDNFGDVLQVIINEVYLQSADSIYQYEYLFDYDYHEVLTSAVSAVRTTIWVKEFAELYRLYGHPQAHKLTNDDVLLLQLTTFFSAIYYSHPYGVEQDLANECADKFTLLLTVNGVDRQKANAFAQLIREPQTDENIKTWLYEDALHCENLRFSSEGEFELLDLYFFENFQAINSAKITGLAMLERIVKTLQEQHDLHRNVVLTYDDAPVTKRYYALVSDKKIEFECATNCYAKATECYEQLTGSTYSSNLISNRELQKQQYQSLNWQQRIFRRLHPFRLFIIKVLEEKKDVAYLKWHAKLSVENQQLLINLKSALEEFGLTIINVATPFALFYFTKRISNKDSSTLLKLFSKQLKHLACAWSEYVIQQQFLEISEAYSPETGSPLPILLTQIADHLARDTLRDYICPISQTIIRQPVQLAGDHIHYFDRQAILSWLVENPTNPLTNQPATIDQIIDADDMRQEITNACHAEIRRAKPHQFVEALLEDIWANNNEILQQHGMHLMMLNNRQHHLNFAEMPENISDRVKVIAYFDYRLFLQFIFTGRQLLDGRFSLLQLSPNPRDYPDWLQDAFFKTNPFLAVAVEENLHVEDYRQFKISEYQGGLSESELIEQVKAYLSSKDINLDELMCYVHHCPVAAVIILKSKTFYEYYFDKYTFNNKQKSKLTSAFKQLLIASNLPLSPELFANSDMPDILRYAILQQDDVANFWYALIGNDELVSRFRFCYPMPSFVEALPRLIEMTMQNRDSIRACNLFRIWSYSVEKYKLSLSFQDLSALLHIAADNLSAMQLNKREVNQLVLHAIAYRLAGLMELLITYHAAHINWDAHRYLLLRFAIVLAKRASVVSKYLIEQFCRILENYQLQEKEAKFIATNEKLISQLLAKHQQKFLQLLKAKLYATFNETQDIETAKWYITILCNTRDVPACRHFLSEYPVHYHELAKYISSLAHNCNNALFTFICLYLDAHLDVSESYVNMLATITDLEPVYDSFREPISVHRFITCLTDNGFQHVFAGEHLPSDALGYYRQGAKLNLVGDYLKAFVYRRVEGYTEQEAYLHAYTQTLFDDPNLVLTKPELNAFWRFKLHYLQENDTALAFAQKASQAGEHSALRAILQIGFFSSWQQTMPTAQQVDVVFDGKQVSLSPRQ